MRIHDVSRAVGDAPYMTFEQAEAITNFITTSTRNHPRIGFRARVSTCYMAAALSELGRGSIVTIDLELTRHATPNVEELLDRVGERDRVSVFYEPTSYTWRLMRFLEEDPTPALISATWMGPTLGTSMPWRSFSSIDFCDPRWVIFDDLNWTMQRHRNEGQELAKHALEKTTLR